MSVELAAWGGADNGDGAWSMEHGPMGGQVEDKKGTGRANPGGIQWTKMPKLTFLFALARWACILSLPRCSSPS